MLWPNSGETLLVNADHTDIVGHFKRVLAVAHSDRKYDSYDLLKSGSGFDSNSFAKVWNGVFDFCVG
jgi:triacylglycerol lipase